VQTVSAAFTAEERDVVRSIAHNLQISWHKQNTLGNVTFTIGTSVIGGADVIGANPGNIGSPGIYKYFDESAYVTGLGWEQEFSMPLGGISMALAEANLDNTSGRFLPRVMGGRSELYTAIQSRKPMIINAGFNYGGVDNLIPQFSGILNKQPSVDFRQGEVKLSAADYVDFFRHRRLERVATFTAQTTDVVVQQLLVQMGLASSQYVLDPGINVIPFAQFDVDTKFYDAINKLVEAEDGRFYQDEQGIFRFENRQHWDSAPYTQVQKLITTSQVINAAMPTDEHLINTVDVNVDIRAKQPMKPVLNYSSPEQVNPFSKKEVFLNFDNPVLQAITPTEGGFDSFYLVNTSKDETGVFMTGAVNLKSFTVFSQAAKCVFENVTADYLYVTRVVVSARAAEVVKQVRLHDQLSESVTAYEERSITLDNPFIATEDWAGSYASMILQDYGQIENIQTLTIRAMPSLQLGDLVSWQGRYWRIFGKKVKLDASEGFVQELKMLQRQARQYFRIGISTIGSSTDAIAP
jgi:hypothetical protein